jgi:hypothetical protein
MHRPNHPRPCSPRLIHYTTEYLHQKRCKLHRVSRFEHDFAVDFLESARGLSRRFSEQAFPRLAIDSPCASEMAYPE